MNKLELIEKEAACIIEGVLESWFQSTLGWVKQENTHTNTLREREREREKLSGHYILYEFVTCARKNYIIAIKRHQIS